MSQDLFKVGLIVPDIEAAMCDVGAWLEIQWTPVQSSPISLQTAEGREDLQLRFAYSIGGDLLFELLEAHESGYYAAPEGAHLHHVGRWVDDLDKASARLSAQGIPLEAAGIGPDGSSPALFAFHRGDHGMRIELVDRAMQANFGDWLAGGELELG